MNAGKSVVACLGSSTTAGKGQAFNWIAELERRSRNSGICFRNFGVGGDLAYNELQRLPEVIASRPDKVLVLLGGNDVIALVSKKAGIFFSLFKHLPTKPSPEWFRENLGTIARRLKNESSARVALCSLSPIGEDPTPTDAVQAEFNRRIEEYSVIVQAVAREEGATYLPFYERVHEEIEASPGRAFTRFRFLPFYRDAFRIVALHKTPDEVARINGWRFHTDGVHLNSLGGMILADLAQEFIDEP
jgi:lysophospholipase L1-like esterase